MGDAHCLCEISNQLPGGELRLQRVRVGMVRLEPTVRQKTVERAVPDLPDEGGTNVLEPAETSVREQDRERQPVRTLQFDFKMVGEEQRLVDVQGA